MSARRFPFSLMPSNRRQWLALCVIAAVLLAHLALIEWAKDSLALIRMLDAEDDTVMVELQAASPEPAVTQKSSETPKPPSLPARPRAPLLPAAPPSTEPSAPSAAATDSAQSNTAEAAKSSTSDTASALVSPPTSSPTSATASATANTTSSVPKPEQETGSTSPPLPPLFARVSFPPSAELRFDALAVQGNRQLSGSGSIVWQQDGQNYLIKGEASALLLTLLSYQSSGQIGAAGILPVQYDEKRIGKSATSTHFVRERKTISFSASTAIYEIQGGEQDRGSVIWQLAGLARGDPDKLAAGLAFDAVIAGSKAADRWNVQVIGKENLALNGNNVSAWHLALAPTENNFDYQIDLWLSPEREWYPAKIMYANRSGATLTLTLAKLNRK